MRKHDAIEASVHITAQLKRVIHLFRDDLEEALRPFGITPAQLYVLATLGKEPGTSGARLARLCGVTPQSTQGLLVAVERRGWIEREKHPENERILLATLTRAGEELLESSRHAARNTERRMLHGFNHKEVALLDELLGRCAANLETIQHRQSKRS
jgi:MarR family transcriptional regulator, organic hydroperoxide resistance regulator